MNEKRRTVVAVGIAAMLVALLFFAPWRIESAGEIEWAPIFRPPITFSQSYATSRPGARYTYAEAKIDAGLFLAEILAIGSATAIGLMLVPGRDRNDDT